VRSVPESASFHIDRRRTSAIDPLLSCDFSAARAWPSAVPRFPQATNYPYHRDEPPSLRDDANRDLSGLEAGLETSFRKELNPELWNISFNIYVQHFTLLSLLSAYALGHFVLIMSFGNELGVSLHNAFVTFVRKVF